MNRRMDQETQCVIKPLRLLAPPVR